MTISVLIPTYCRQQDLCRCLEALKRQTHPADEVLVVVRDTDRATQVFLDEFDPGPLPLRRVPIAVPGVVAAMNAGLAEATGDILALTDDDAAPHPDWLERILAHFLHDAMIAGVGGRDWLPWREPEQPVVGKVQWHGRVIGNHHLGVGGAREVDVLKGVNCAFRADPLRRIGFDTRLWGNGAQVHWELSLCLSLKRAGWKMIYDPAVALDHFSAPREDKSGRGRFLAEAHRDAVHNETLVMLDYLPPVRRVAYAAYTLTIGTRESPGLVQVPRLLLQRERAVLPRLNATLNGRMNGWKTFRRVGSASVTGAMPESANYLSAISNFPSSAPPRHRAEFGRRQVSNLSRRPNAV